MTFNSKEEVPITGEVEKSMLDQVLKKTGYLCSDCSFENKLFKGSFKEPFSEEYLLVSKYHGPMASSGIFIGLFNKDKSLMAAENLGGGTHSLSDFRIYDCNNKGLSLFLMDYRGCSNGSPFCSVNDSLYSFNEKEAYVFQRVIGEEGFVDIGNDGIDLYKWKLFDYSSKSSYDSAGNSINEENCKKNGCKEYWEYSPYTRSYLLLDDKLVYNKESCMFEKDNGVASAFDNFIAPDNPIEKEDKKLTDEQVKELMKAEKVVWNDSPRCVDVILSGDGFKTESDCTGPVPPDSCLDSTYKAVSFGEEYRVRKCQKPTTADIFEDDHFLDKEIILSNITDLATYYTDHDRLDNGLSPEKVTFLLLANKIMSYSKDSRYYYTDQLSASGAILFYWQDYPNPSVKVLSADISNNIAIVKYVIPSWGKEEKSLVLKFDGKNWRADFVLGDMENYLRLDVKELNDDWSYVYVNNSSDNTSCGYENLVLINEKEKRFEYVFNTRTNYNGGMGCLNPDFKYDPENEILYFGRSYEFCMSSYYQYDLKIGKLSEMDDNLVGFDVREVDLEKLAEKQCFTDYFDKFKSYHIDK
jgi:hypothetical protein